MYQLSWALWFLQHGHHHGHHNLALFWRALSIVLRWLILKG